MQHNATSSNAKRCNKVQQAATSCFNTTQCNTMLLQCNTMQQATTSSGLSAYRCFVDYFNLGCTCCLNTRWPRSFLLRCRSRPWVVVLFQCCTAEPVAHPLRILTAGSLVVCRVSVLKSLARNLSLCRWMSDSLLLTARASYLTSI